MDKKNGAEPTGGMNIQHLDSAALGVNYFLNWAVTVAVEIAAAAMILQFWVSPDLLPGWVWSLLFLLFMVSFNVLSVRELACGSGVFIATLLFDPSMSAPPIILKQNSISVGLFTH
ncbi:hypothetical protein BGZ50_006892 [Haplosporangium sp. Z 11]|nr:hypothetical protein BGZ50_006892 [Haplosporangium sp. Z 11]